MRLLVLGGTVFLGRAIARLARDAGHEVTCAARGESGTVPEGVVFKKIERDDPATLSSLDGEFDATVDLSRVPRHVRSAVEALGERAGHWCFVSSISVYSDVATPWQRADSAPLLRAAGPDDDDFAADTYGERKVACEQAMPPGSFIVRPGLVVGPEDASNRFAYWVSRLERGGEVLAPGSPDDLVQWIDVRDLAAWIVKAAETRLAGAFDAICAPVTRLEMLTGMGFQPTLVWVDQDFLIGQGVEPWMGERALPLWLKLPEFAGFMSRDPSTALEAGLTIRPLEQTAQDTVDWLHTAPKMRITAGISAEDERDLLASYGGG